MIRFFILGLLLIDNTAQAQRIITNEDARQWMIMRLDAVFTKLDSALTYNTIKGYADDAKKVRLTSKDLVDTMSGQIHIFDGKHEWDVDSSLIFPFETAKFNHIEKTHWRNCPGQACLMVVFQKMNGKPLTVYFDWKKLASIVTKEELQALFFALNRQGGLSNNPDEDQWPLLPEIKSISDSLFKATEASLYHAYSQYPTPEKSADWLERYSFLPKDYNRLKDTAAGRKMQCTWQSPKYGSVDLLGVAAQFSFKIDSNSIFIPKGKVVSTHMPYLPIATLDKFMPTEQIDLIRYWWWFAFTEEPFLKD